MRGSARYLFELSLEHSDFPHRELAAVSERLGDKCTRASKRICIVESSRTGVEMKTYGETLAFCLRISALHGEYSDWEALKRGLEGVASAARGSTACVRVASGDEDIRRRKPALERELGSLVSRYCTIRLDKPETEVRIVAEAGAFFLATKIMDVDRSSVRSFIPDDFSLYETSGINLKRNLLFKASCNISSSSRVNVLCLILIILVFSLMMVNLGQSIFRSCLRVSETS